LKKLNEIFAAGIDHQRAYLSTLKYERSLEWRNGMKDLSVEDIGKYFRDRYLEEWTQAGAPGEEGKEVMKRIELMFEGYSSDPIQRLKEGADQYIRATGKP
jgi:hypothetical protein